MDGLGKDEHDAEQPWAAVDFLARLRADDARGEARPLREYLAAYPSHEELVAREYLQARSLDRRARDEEGSAREFGPFRLLEEIGSGGEGQVFLAHEAVLDRLVALKLVRSSLGELAEARFLRAAALAARLDHPSLCRVLEAGRSEAALWVAMQYVPGRALEAELDERRRLGAALDEREAARHVASLLRGLAHAHERGVLHRDVKASNVIVNDGAWVLTDFGLARDVEARTAMTQRGDMAGTLAFMSPELLAGEDATPASDVWACAVLLFECVTLARPFEGASIAAVLEAIRRDEAWEHEAWRSLSRDMRAVLATALHKEPGARYLDAAAFADELDRFARGEPVAARTPGALVRLRAWARREPALAAGLAVALLALVAISAVSSLWWSRERVLREQTQESAQRTRDAARAIVFDFDDAMSAGKDALAARARLVAHAKDLLVVLCEEAGVDGADSVRLRRELALAWMRLGDLYGSPGEANRGQRGEAERCYREAERLARASAERDPRAPALLVASLVKRAGVELGRSEALYREALACVGEGAVSAELARLRGIARAQLAGFARDRREYGVALELVRAAGRDFELADGPRARPEDRAALRDTEATVLAARGEVAQATRMLEAALEEEGLSIGLRSSLRLHYAQCLELEGRSEEALREVSGLEATWRDRLARDPSELGALRRVLSAREERGRILARLGRSGEARASWLEARGLAQRLGDAGVLERLDLRLRQLGN